MREATGPLRYRAFRLQFAAEAVSFLGNAISPVALALGILQAGGSAATLGLVLAAGIAPAAVFVLVGGVWADRLPRQRLIAVSDTIHALTQFAIAAMFLTGHLNLGLMIAVQLVAGTATAFDLPAATGLVTHTVPAEQLQRANALLSLARSLTGSLGPLIAGAFVLTVGAGWAIALDGLTFLVSAALLVRLRTPAMEPAPRRDFLGELRGGLREVTSRPWIWTGIVGYMASHLCLAALLVLGPTIALERTRGVAVWAAIIASMSIGEIVGDVLALRLSPRRPMFGARVVELLMVPVMVALAFDTSTPVLIVAAALAGLSITFPDALWYTALQQHLPGDAVSRVSSYDWLGGLTIQPLGFATIAVFAAWAGRGATLLAVAALLVLTRLVALSFTDVRELRGLRPATEPAG